jgi:hypothetical protein
MSKIRWANFLHIYQPIDQQQDILEAVVTESYRPLLEGLKKNKKSRLTLNINASLVELFDKYGYRDLIDLLRELITEGRLELTGSAKYHAILPLIPKEEAVRQIIKNNETNKFFLGEQYKPEGFFPPEMAFSPELVPIVEELGFKWMILDEIACNGSVGSVDYSKVYKIANSKLKLMFRERRISNLIMSAAVRSKDSLMTALNAKNDRYVLTGMDGETFGHHRPGLENLLFEIFSGDEFELLTCSDVLKDKDIIEINPVASTWASSEQDIEKGIQFLSWKDPDNQIHGWQWEFVNLVLNEVRSMTTSNFETEIIREEMDAALSSDHFWWASAKPWWSLEMIEFGAYRLLDIIRKIPNIDPKKAERAAKLYENIVSTAFQWKRSGKIREIMEEYGSVARIPFKERTLGKGGVEVGIYEAFIDMMKKLETEAVAKKEYEKAIMWRDAVYKIDKKLDIYDAINIIDLVRLQIPNEEIEKMLDVYTAKYKKIRGGQPEQRGS